MSNGFLRIRKPKTQGHLSLLKWFNRFRGNLFSVIFNQTVKCSASSVETSQKLLEVEKWSPEGDDVALRNSTFIRRFEPTGRPPWMTLILPKLSGKFLRGGVRPLASGVSTREMQKVKPGAPGVSKSNISRLWQQAGSKFVDELRGRDISNQNWVGLMLDGIRLSKDQLAVVALGITAEGFKFVLDFELGTSESAEVSLDLMRHLDKRGFSCERRLFAALDGSAALRSAVKEFFPDSVIQRCLVHEERNIRSKLSKKHWGELARLFKRLREVQGKVAAQEVVKELEEFLKGKNAESLKSLREAGEDLIALQSLDVPNTLHRNMLSTNAIENSFRNTRNKLGRVTRF